MNNSLEEIVKRVTELMRVNSSANNSNIHYDCEICNDSEWIINAENNSASPCRCREAKFFKKIVAESGISQTFSIKTFNNYEIKDDQRSKARAIAINYADNFNEISKSKNNSIAFLGQVGAGKTHLSIAIANELLNKGIGVCYMPYRESITKIKQTITDEINYANEINKYKKAKVLLIDDLFKGATDKNKEGLLRINAADERAMFEIVNYRYIANAPMIISSELTIDMLLDLDEGLISRIIEMCNGNIFKFEGETLNNRYYS